MGLVTRECPDPVGAEFRVCFDEQNYGLELKTALENMITRMPLQDLKIVVTAILIQKESGGNLAEVLEKTAQVIRERFRLKRQVMTHTAQGRLTGLILTLLPVVLGCAVVFRQPGHDELAVEARDRNQAALCRWRHDRRRRSDHSQDRQHGRVERSYGICNHFVCSRISC